MSGVPVGSQMDIQFPPNLPIPTYYTNIVQTAILDDEVYLNFCIRSMEKPLLQANLQCRIITTVPNLRRLIQGLTALLAQHDQKKQAQGQADEAAATQQAKPARPEGERKPRPG
jgi:hypothetical protein